MLIKNYEELAKTPQRKIVLDLVEAALVAIQPEKIISQKISLSKNKLKIDTQEVNLADFEKVIILGFGKGSAKNAKIIENILKDKITEGYVIDTNQENFQKIEFSQGTHPLPSQANIDFTQKVIKKLSNLTPKDLVLVITCGGGSVMLGSPHNLSLEQMVDVNKTLLHSGATIQDMNIIRKHIDIVKGGGLAKILFPAKAINLVFSDVPGNDLSTIASGPMVMDPTTKEDVQNVIKKYNLSQILSFEGKDFVESPKDEKYFQNVENVLILKNGTALSAMLQKAEELGVSAQIYSDHFQDNANGAGNKLSQNAKNGTILIAGGETDVKVGGSGVGGRNQQAVLAALLTLAANTTICFFDSDGWDNSKAAGAIGDFKTLQSAKAKGLDINKYLQNNDAYTFFEKVGDAILTERLPSNVSDLMIVYKHG